MLDIQEARILLDVEVTGSPRRQCYCFVEYLVILHVSISKDPITGIGVPKLLGLLTLDGLLVEWEVCAVFSTICYFIPASVSLEIDKIRIIGAVVVLVG